MIACIFHRTEPLYEGEVERLDTGEFEIGDGVM